MYKPAKSTSSEQPTSVKFTSPEQHTTPEQSTSDMQSATFEQHTTSEESTTSERSTTLEQSIGFVMGITYRKLLSLLQQTLKSFDITSEQWSVLNRIYSEDGLIQKEIAERTVKDKPTITRILDQLEQKGLIRKESGQKDRRSFLIYITPKGRSLMEDTIPIEQQLVTSLNACMSDEESELLIKLLLRLNRHASELLHAQEIKE